MQPADVARLAVEIALEIDEGSVDDLFVESDGRMRVMGRECGDRGRREVGKTFQEGSDPRVGEVQVEPKETIGYFKIAAARIKRQSGAWRTRAFLSG